MLHVIQGRSGSGKTTWVREKIKQVIETTDTKPLLIVPDQFSFETDRTMLTMLGAQKMNRVEICGFSRLATSNLDAKIIEGKLFATDGVRMAYMSEAIKALEDELKVFSKVRHNVPGLKAFVDFNKELESCDVSCDDIIAVTEKMSDGLLKDKLTEINLINEAYTALLHQSYFDDTECLKYFVAYAEETGFFKNKTVFLDSFKAFSEQQLKCIRLALIDAKDVYITICSEENSGEDSPFAYMNNLKHKIEAIAKRAGVSIDNVTELKVNDSLNNSIRHIEQNIYSAEQEALSGDASGVTILKCRDISDECNTVALEIKKLIRSGECRCRDIAIVERSNDKYKRILCDVLKRYGVPVFDDSRRQLSFETLFIHVTSAIECIAENFKTESVMRYLKTGLTQLSYTQVAALEKYVLVWGVSGSGWLNDFTLHPNGFGNVIDDAAKGQIEYLNKLRKKVILPLLKLKKECEGVSGLDVTKAVYEFLVETKVTDRLYELSNELCNEGFPVEAEQKERSWDALIELFDTIAEITKDKYYTIKRWYELFSILVFSKDIGEIPQGLDEVKIGNADRIRTEGLKVIFLVGVNKNEFPLISPGSGLLTDSDRRILVKDLFLNINPAFEETVAEEKFLVYCMLTAASEKLYLSYREVSDDETTSGASELIEDIKALLPSVKVVDSCDIDESEKIESDFSAFFTLAKMYNQNTELKSTLYEYFKTKPEYFGRLESISLAKNGKKGEFKNPPVSKRLFGENIGISASRLDKFYTCPFSFFCQYGLKAKAVKAAQLQPTDSGLIIHGVLEAVLSKYPKGEFLTIPEKVLKDFVSEYLKNYLLEKMGGFNDKSKRFMFLYNRMVDVLMVIFERLKNEFSGVSFTPTDFELKIGDDNLPQYTLPLEDGGKISVYGSVDRVDIMEKGDTKYLRIIDYKTGSKEFKLSHLLSGLNAQMVIYLMAIIKNGTKLYGKTVPAGVLYLPSRIGIKNYLSERNPSPDNIEAQKRTSGKLSGMVLKDDDVLDGMGINQFPDYLPVSYKKKTGLSGNYFSEKNFEELSKIVDGKIQEMGKALHNGAFPVLPSSNGGETKQCNYCEYRSVCGFEVGDKTNEICNDSHSAILEMLGGDSNE